MDGPIRTSYFGMAVGSAAEIEPNRGEDAPELLEWFRLDRPGGTKWLLVVGATCVFFGCGTVAGAFLTHSNQVVHLISTFGAGLLLTGLIIAFGGMALLLANDDYLGVRADGILVHRARGDHGTDVVLPWDDIRRVHSDKGVLLLEGHGEDDTFRVPERYTGASPVELAAHLESLRRKSQMERLSVVTVKRIAIGLPHVMPK